jgi:uncharacterized membrane protein
VEALAKAVAYALVEALAKAVAYALVEALAKAVAYALVEALAKAVGILAEPNVLRGNFAADAWAGGRRGDNSFLGGRHVIDQGLFFEAHFGSSRNF